jgi:peptidoglycan hydrolase-like protein with peptidoglycan-binding domain
MSKKQVAAAVLVASLFAAPVAMAQTAGGTNGVNGNGGGRSLNARPGNGAANTGANNGIAGNGANNGMPSQRVTNEYASGAGAIITVSPSAVREVQQALNRLGYAAGPINGVWDHASADAMVHFQQAHGLEPTGNLNLSSIAGLGLWDNIIGDPLGNGNKSLTVGQASGSPPPRGGKNAAKVGGAPLPSQRVVNETPNGGKTTGAAGGAGAAGNANTRR